MTRYDVNAAWDDPFERRVERREERRAGVPLEINISVDRSGLGVARTRKAAVKDISLSGIQIATDEKLIPGQLVGLTIPTTLCRDDLCLPEAFVGPARVLRCRETESEEYIAILLFGNRLTANMEFSVFIENLQAMSGLFGPEKVRS